MVKYLHQHKMANRRGLRAATGLVLLLEIGLKYWFLGPCDLENWWLTSKNYRAPLLHYDNLWTSFQSHQWIQTGVTVWKHSIRVKIGHFLSLVTLKLDGWHWKTIGHLFYATLSFTHHFIAICEFKIELQSGSTQFGSKSIFFVLCDLAIRQMILENNGAPLLCYFKLCASFHNHWWTQA